MKIDKDFLKNALEVAEKAAVSSGKILLSIYKKLRVIKDKKKDIQDFVTDADLKSEENIKEKIFKAFPNHSVLAEEAGYQWAKTRDFLWMIDPLCGTANFVNQIDLFSLSIGLVYKQKPVLGVIYKPIKKRLVSAVVGQGAFLNKRQVWVSKTGSLDLSMVAMTMGKTLAKRKRWAKKIGRLITRVYKLREFGSTPVSCSFLANGRIDGYIALPDVWDVVASIVIVEEAGGKISDWSGNKWSLNSDSFVASNGKIHNELIKILKEGR